MMDARNLACQDEIAFATGKRVKVHVAHELRILEALEKYYKEECPSRYSLLAERLNRARYFWERPEPRAESATTLATPYENLLGVAGRARPATLPPPPPLPDMPFAQATPVRQRPAAAVAVVPPPAAARPRPAAPAPVASVPAPVIAKPTPVVPEPTPVAPKPAPRPRSQSVPLSAEERAALGGAPPTTLEEFEKVLAVTQDRDTVGRMVLAFLLLDHKRAALFQTSRDKILAWQAQGEGVNAEIFQRYAVGFDQPSLFLNLREGSSVYLGPLPPMPAHREFARAWGGELPRDCVMLPLRLRNRLVAVLYADGSKKVDLVHLQRLATAAADALGRCILLKKQGEARP
jgi:hypothetical protein